MAPPNNARASSRRFDTRAAVQIAPAAGDPTKQDAFGVVDQSKWRTVRSVWCYLLRETGSESVFGGQSTSQQTFRVGFRRHPMNAINTKNRLSILTGRYRGVTLTVQALAGETRGETLEAICVSVG